MFSTGILILNVDNMLSTNIEIKINIKLPLTYEKKTIYIKYL